MFFYLSSPFEQTTDLSFTKDFKIFEKLVDIFRYLVTDSIVLFSFFRAHFYPVKLGEYEQRIHRVDKLGQGSFLVQMHGSIILVTSSFPSIL